VITRKLSDARPLAAVSGEVPDCVFVALTYELLTQETKLLIERLRPLSDDRTSFLAMEGKLHLAIYGLEDDPREICEVPEVATMTDTLLHAVPALPWYLALDTDLPSNSWSEGAVSPSSAARAVLLAGCVERIGPVGPGQPMAMRANELYPARVEQIVRCIGNMCARYDVTQQRFQSRFKQLAQLLGIGT